MAEWAVTTAGAWLEFDTGNGQSQSCHQIDSTHYLNLWTGTNNDGFAQVFAVNTTTWAVTTAASSLEFDTDVSSHNDSFKIDDTHIILFSARTDIDGFAQVFTVNTSTWAVTTAGSALEFDTTNGQYNSCYQIDSNHFINFWLGPLNDGYVQVFTVNTTTWEVTTAAGSLVFDTNGGLYNSCKKIDANHFINFYQGGGDDGYVQVFTVNTTTWEVTTSAGRLRFDTVTCYYNSCLQIDSTHFINFWGGEDTGGSTNYDGFVQVFVVNTTTWAVTTAADRLEFDTTRYFVGAAPAHNIVAIDTTHFVACWAGGSGTTGYSQVFSVNTTTWAVTTAAAPLNFDTSSSSGGYGSLYLIDSSHFIQFWAGEASDGYVQVFAVELPAAGVTMDLTCGQYALTGKDTTFTLQAKITTEVGAYTLTGNDATLTGQLVLLPEKGEYALTGNDASFSAAIISALEKGTYTLEGKDTGLTAQINMAVDDGTYALTGKDVTLTGDITFSLDCGTYTLTGNGVVTGIGFTAQKGAYALTGKDVMLNPSFIFINRTSGIGSLTVSGTSAIGSLTLEQTSAIGSLTVERNSYITA